MIYSRGLEAQSSPGPQLFLVFSAGAAPELHNLRMRCATGMSERDSLRLCLGNPARASMVTERLAGIASFLTGVRKDMARRAIVPLYHDLGAPFPLRFTKAARPPQCVARPEG